MNIKIWLSAFFMVSLVVGCASWQKEKAASGEKIESPGQIAPRQRKILESLPLGIIGGTEWVHIEKLPQPLLAKIDTGADNCSISAVKLRFFERDGKKWVSFQIPGNAQMAPTTLERPLVRRTLIKRHGTTSMERPVVALKIRLGERTMLRNFSLTDRSKFTYPVLIGQNLLKGLAAVDVSRNCTLGR